MIVLPSDLIFLAFFFHVFYYVYLGMWKKGLTLFGICIVIQAICTAIFAPGTAFSAVLLAWLFGRRANIDFYKRRMLGNDEWI